MKLYPFQEESVEKQLQFLRKIKATYNGCDMGLGKCVQTLEIIKRLGAVNVLVLCPSSVKFVWREEEKKYLGTENLVICSYNKAAMPAYLKQLTEFRWDVLVLDEAHYLKNRITKRTKAVLKKIWPLAEYKICLSGTPLTKCVTDCWTLFDKILPNTFGGFWEFAWRYTNVKKTPWGDQPEGIKNAEELKSIIRSNFFVRYRKVDVLKDLPPKTWQKIPLEASYCVRLSPAEEKQNEEYAKALKQFFISGKRLAIALPKSIATWRREEGVKKVPKVIEFCKELLDQDLPIVVFTYHKEVLNLLKEALHEHKPCIIEGSTSEAGRETAVRDFQSGKSNLFIGQLKAAGTGITLVRASIAVFAELDWTPAVVSQAVDRIYRIGQNSAVIAYYFSPLGSIEEGIMEGLIRRLQESMEVLN